jgi:hypothetical protein
MTKKTRRKMDAALKAKTALEALPEHATVASGAALSGSRQIIKPGQYLSVPLLAL